MSQGLNIAQNAVAPDAPDSGYRILFPMADGWYEKDGAGVVYKLTNAVTGSGVIATGGFTLTIPATGTAALLEAANVFTNASNTFQGGVNIGTSIAGAPVGAIYLSDGTRSAALAPRSAAAGALSAGYDLAAATDQPLNLYGSGATGGVGGGVNLAYYDSSAAAWRAALTYRNAAGLTNLDLMPAGGTVTIGGGLNVGTSGAEAGGIRASGILRLGGVTSSYIYQQNVTLASNASATLMGGGAQSALLLILNSSGVAIYQLNGASNNVTEAVDPNNAYVPNGSGGTTTNIRYSGGNYIIENKTAGSLVYSILALLAG